MNGREESKRRSVLTFRPGDAVAAAAVLLCALALAVGLFLAAGQGGTLAVQVYQDGTLLWEHPLDRDGEFRVSGPYENLVTVRDGRAAITESTCPGGDCVHSGWLSGPGRSVVCLPNRVEVRLTGTGGVDAVVR